MLLSEQKYGRQHEYSCRDHYHATTEYELFLKPHHRLDRKSSRGMIYENEELRLRTININAEIERGQYDIKKLKRENELLKKEIWCLRDEYEKLDKLLKEKDIDFSSSSTTTSESDSCSSCLDESDDVEKNQNLANVQKTNMKNLTRNFEALSVVPEESTENSDLTSNRTSLNGHLPQNDDVLKADQNYPTTIRLADGNISQNFLSLDRFDPQLVNSYHDESMVYPNEYYSNATKRHLCNQNDSQYSNKKIINTNATNFYQNIVLVPKKASYTESETLQKGGTDVLVKMDNKNFALNHEANGGGDTHYCDSFPRYAETFGRNSQSTFSNGGNLEELLNDIETISQDILSISNAANNDYFNSTRRCKSDINPTDKQSNSENEKPFKSELNVTLMPQPMALIGLEKYRDIQRSMNTTPSKSLENLQNQGLHVFNAEDNHSTKRDFQHYGQSSIDVPEFVPNQTSPINVSADSPQITQHSNFPAYLSSLKDNYVGGDYFSRYNTENHQMDDNRNVPRTILNDGVDEKDSKPKPLLKQISIDVPPSENDENSKIKTTNSTTQDTTWDQHKESTEKIQQKPKVGLRKKVSIHFRGKKEKQKKTQASTSMIKKLSPVRDKRDAKLEENKVDKTKLNTQKTSSKDSTRAVSETDKNIPETRRTVEKSDTDRKLRKSSSVSPDRKKNKEDKKCKKHKKERMKARRATVTSLESRDHRARSHSVATERSNTYGGSHFFYDDDALNSERDSVSSSETLKTRQINFSNIPVNGKVPWCGCWGNGCI